MNKPYKATLSQHALPQFLPTWGGKGGVEDPMFEKYPSISPYTYCANNPIKYVDPTGETLVITGGASSEAVGQLENMTSKKFTLIHNSDNTVTYVGKARNRYDRYLKKIIDNQDITVNVKAENTDYFTTKDNKTASYLSLDNIVLGGAYGGTEVSLKSDVNTYQYVNPEKLSLWDDKTHVRKGIGMLHEVSESYEAGKIAIRRREGDIGDKAYYDRAHIKAEKYALGSIGYIDIPIAPNTRKNSYQTHILRIYRLTSKQ